MNVLSFASEIVRRFPFWSMIIAAFLLAASLAEIVSLASALPLLSIVFDTEKTVDGIPGEILKTLNLENLDLEYLLLIIGTLVIARTILMTSSVYVITYVRILIVAKLQTSIMDTFLNSRWSYVSQQEPGHLNNTIMTQSETAGTAVLYLGKLITAIVMAGIFAATSLFVSWKFVALGILLTIPLLLIAFAINKRSRIVATKTVEAQSLCSGQVIENIKLSKYIKSSSSESNFQILLEKIITRIVKLRKKDAKYLASIQAIPKIYVVIVVLFIFYVMTRVIDENINNTIFTILLMQRAASRLNSVQTIHRSLVSAIPAYEACMRQTQDASDAIEWNGSITDRTFSKSIELDNVTLTLNKGNIILDGVTLSIPKNQTVALVGKSGAGKTTVVDLLLGLHHPTSGTVKLDGTDLRELEVANWRKRIAYVTQDTALIRGTIRQNIIRDDETVSDADFVQISELAHINEFVRELTDGYDTLIDGKGVFLSGGQKQRIALARALIRKPEILILDEATSALDGLSEDVIRQTLQNLRHKLTVVVISHRASTIRDADTIYVMDQGKIAESGPFDDLMDRQGVFRQLYTTQSR